MGRMDDFPTHELGGVKYRRGITEPFGAWLITDNVVNFSVFSKDATSCELLLYNKGEDDPYVSIPLTDEFRIGDVYCVTVYGLDYEQTEYGYMMDGPYDPEHGYRFNNNKVLLDPYAKMVSGREKWGQATDLLQQFQHRGMIIPHDYDWGDDKPLEIPFKDLVIYETHVRGFTMHESSGVKHRGTYLGLIDKIPYLK